MTSVSRLVFVCGFLMAAAVSLLAQSAPSPEAELKAAMHREVVDRDVTGAMEDYQRIAKAYATNVPVASRALFQLGGIYERLGRVEARQAYQQIVAKYPNSGQVVAMARARLGALGQASPGPFKIRDVDGWFRDAPAVEGSADGRYIAYWRKANAAVDALYGVYVRDLQNGRERVLTELKRGEEAVGTPKWSGDSRYVGIASAADGRIEHRVVEVASRRAHTLVTNDGRIGATHYWSPDSRRVAIVVRQKDGPAEVHIFTIGSTARVNAGMTSAPQANRPFGGLVWAFDSTRVAFLRFAQDGNGSIVIAPVDGGVSRELPLVRSQPDSRILLQAWTQTDEILIQQVVAGGNEFALLKVADGSSRKICEGRGGFGGDGCQGLSPDGQLQITRRNQTGGGRIALRRTSDGSERTLTPEAVLEQTAVGFSPDSRLFMFRSNRDGGSGLYVVPTDAIPVVNPVKVMGFESDSTTAGGWWTSRGAVLRINNNQTNQFRVDVDARSGRPTGAPVRLTERTTTNIQAHVSPDARRIAYVVRSSFQGFGIGLMDANGIGERIVKDVPADRLARMRLQGWLSQDEVLISDPGDGPGDARMQPKQLLALNVDTGVMKPIVASLDATHMIRLGSASLIYENLKYDLMVSPISGSPSRPLGLSPNLWNLVTTPDGQTLVYTAVDESAGRGKPWPAEIRMRSLDGGNDRLLLKFADSNGGVHDILSLSRDGKFLLYRDPLLAIRILNTETLDHWPLVSSSPAGVTFDYADARWSPDGTFVVLEGFSARTSWRVVEGLTYDSVSKLSGKSR